MMSELNDRTDDYKSRRRWLSRERVLSIVLLVATVLVVYLCYQLARPFLPALAWALALAVIAHPLHDWLARCLRQANVAAGVAVVLVALSIVAPTLFVTQRLGREAARGVAWLQSESAAGQWQAALDSAGYPRTPGIRAAMTGRAEQISPPAAPPGAPAATPPTAGAQPARP